MRKDDIERMISLSDDRYVEEMFAEKLRGGRKNIFLTFAAVAAGLALFAGGIGYFVSNAGNSDKITADETLVYEQGTVDYSLYFQNTYQETTEVIDDDWAIESAGIFCYFSDGEYVKQAVPFDISELENANCTFCYNYKDEVKTILIHASDRTDDMQENVKSVSVAAFESGEFFPHLSLGKCKSMKRFDVDVYGFNFRETDNFIGVIFAMDDKEYYVGGENISYDEIGILMDSIIENGLWSDSFDLSRAEMEYYDISADITLEEANTVLPFAGHVPQTEEFGDMKLNGKVAYNAGRDEANAIVPKWLYFTYYNGSDKDICLQYFTYAADISPLENEVKLEDIEINRLSEFRTDGNHAFTIDCGGFKINVWANGCTDEEILNFTATIRTGADGMDGYVLSNITLEQANTIEPYAGYIPQSGNIGEMTLNGVSCDDGSADGENNILVSYSQDVPDKYILLYYETFRKGVDPIPLSEVYGRLDSLAEPSTAKDGGADCKHYGFAIDCGEFIIKVSADCTPEEIETCINEILAYSNVKLEPITLAEAANLEPFGMYVPSRESGSMKLEKGILNRYDGEPMSLHLTFSEGVDSLVIAYLRDTVDLSNIPAKNIIPIESIDWTAVNNFVENKKTFYIDCGSIMILVSADCPIEQVWFYIEQIKGTAAFNTAQKDGKLITMDKVKELARKGEELTWSDFESYYGVDVGSGLYIMVYAVDGTDYTVSVGGGSLNEKPMYIHFGSGDGNYIDLRYDSVDDFLN